MNRVEVDLPDIQVNGYVDDAFLASRDATRRDRDLVTCIFFIIDLVCYFGILILESF